MSLNGGRMKTWNSRMRRASFLLVLWILALSVIGQECKYYEQQKRKEKQCSKTAGCWLKENHAKFGFAPKLPIHRFELYYDEGNMDDLSVYCDYKRGRLDAEYSLNVDSIARLEERLDTELTYRLKLLEEKVPVSDMNWMFEMYQGFEWHVIEFHFDVNDLRLLRVEYITDAYECKIIRISP